MEIYIHIGHHKTASTFLQRVFQSNSDVNLLNDFVQPWNDELIKTLISKEDYSIEKVKQITDQRIIENKVNIISAERLSGHPYSCGYDAEIIKDRILECFPKANIIIVKREVKAFTLSVYKQIVKEGYCGTLKDFFDTNEWKANSNRTKYLSQQPLIDSYLSQFENVLVLSFEDLVRDENEFLNAVSQFLKVSLKNNMNERVNPPWGNRRINAMKSINKHRKTELNQFPFINLGDKFTGALSRMLQLFYRNTIK